MPRLGAQNFAHCEERDSPGVAQGTSKPKFGINAQSEFQEVDKPGVSREVTSCLQVCHIPASGKGKVGGKGIHSAGA
jgi:hypothetical protein